MKSCEWKGYKKRDEEKIRDVPNKLISNVHLLLKYISVLICKQISHQLSKIIFTYFFPMAKTPYKAAVIITEPQPTKVETSRQKIIGRRANLDILTKTDFRKHQAYILKALHWLQNALAIHEPLNSQDLILPSSCFTFLCKNSYKNLVLDQDNYYYMIHASSSVFNICLLYIVWIS